MVVVTLLLTIERERSIKLQVRDGCVNSHSRPCQFCMQDVKFAQSVAFCKGQGLGSQIPKTSSMKRF